MVHHVYHVEDGCLVRFSLLPGGAVKKAQALGGKLRLMAFEWTHLASPRPIYERMVEKMVLKVKHPQSERELRTRVYQRYGFEGRAGWLYPGLSEGDLTGAMGGKAEKKKGGVLRWEGRLGDYVAEMEVELDEDGKMVRLLSEGPKAVSEVPVKGTLSWIELAISRKSGGNGGLEPFGDEDEIEQPPLVKATDEEIMVALTSCAKSAKAHEWWEICNYGEKMAKEKGVKSESFLKAVIEGGGISVQVFQLLEAYEYAELNSWVEQGLKALLPESPLELESQSAWDNPVQSKGDTVEALLKNRLLANPSDGEAWVLRFLHETENRWRWALLGLADEVTSEVAQQIIEKNLEDAIASEEWWIANRVFTALGCSEYRFEEFLEDSDSQLELVDQIAVAALVKKLPEGDPEGKWFKRRKMILEWLSSE